MSDPKELHEAVPPKPTMAKGQKLKAARGVAQLVVANHFLFCLCDDGTFWQLAADMKWKQLPTPPQPDN